MGISVYKIKKWYHMLTGTSILHVDQNMGKSFVSGQLEGYFNDLTQKVLKDSETLENQTLPSTTDEAGNPVVFPVAIFQYGLGAYDLYLQTKDKKYLNQFYRCVEWAINNQQESGAWDNFSFVYPDNPFGAMCQGEGASLLLRAYKHTGEREYLDSAKKALDFMLLPLDEGGTTLYQGQEIILMEYTHLSPVLNGWIFALFGLYDMMLVSPENRYQNAYNGTVETLKQKISAFDNGYWSMYDDRKIASPFYHKLHIAQLEALCLITEENIFYEYKQRFEGYRDRKFNSVKAFVVKAVQKIME